MKRPALIRLLEKAGLTVEDESKLKTTLTTKEVSRRLYRKRAV